MAERDTFVGYIDKAGIIWSKGFGQSKDAEVGFDTQAYNELRADRDAVFAKAEKYLEELYAAGVRARPLTAEQTAKEQALVIKDLQNMMQEMQKEMRKWQNKTGEKQPAGHKTNSEESTSTTPTQSNNS